MEYILLRAVLSRDYLADTVQGTVSGPLRGGHFPSYYAECNLGVSVGHAVSCSGEWLRGRKMPILMNPNAAWSEAPWLACLLSA